MNAASKLAAASLCLVLCLRAGVLLLREQWSLGLPALRATTLDALQHLADEHRALLRAALPFSWLGYVISDAGDPRWRGAGRVA